MRTALRAFALAVMLAALPACSSLGVKFENPVAAAKTVDQQAYALISVYAATLEEATDLVRDPATPASAKRAIGKAEGVATPAIETVQIAVKAYLKAKADAAVPADAGKAERLAASLKAAATNLQAALAAAQTPVRALQAALKS